MEDVITLSHGSGGEQSENLIKNRTMYGIKRGNLRSILQV